MHNSSGPVVSKGVEVKLCLFHAPPRKSPQLKLSTVCTKLKIKFKTYVSFHVSVTEDDFPLIHNTDIRPDGRLNGPFYERLNPDEIFNSDLSYTSHIDPRHLMRPAVWLPLHLALYH
jgi:hypothetical protein